MKKFYIIAQIILVFFLASAAYAQPTPKLVKNFTMAPGTFAGKLGVDLNGKFITDSLGSLLISDGTDTGTHSIVSGFFNIEALLVVNNKLFFVGCDTLPHGNELWVSDGTAAGTHLVKEINPLPYGHGAYYFGFNDYTLIAYHNKVYFYGSDGVHGAELWRSDGTDTGTVMVKDINPMGDAFNLADFAFGALQVAGDKLYFCANDGVNGPELWSTDGTAANTHMVTDFLSGIAGSNPSYLWTLDNKLCFSAFDGADTGVYVTDGTDTGTHLLMNRIIVPNSEHTVMNHKLYFFADSSGIPGSGSLWVTDGTPAGTTWVSHAFYGTIQFSYYSYLSSFLTNWNGKLYFGAADHLWTSTGLVGGTQMVTDFSSNPGVCCTPTQIQDFAGRMYMRVKDFNGRVDIAYSDGTDTGTHIAACPDADFTTGSNFVIQNDLSAPMTVVGNKLFFWNTYQGSLGHSLYVIDMTPVAVANVPAANQEINVYPNPATDKVTIEAAGNEINKVELYNVTGQLLSSTAVNNAWKVSLSLPEYKGIVLARVYTNQGLIAARFLSGL